MKKIKELINELKKTDRGKAILKLSCYMAFFIGVLLLVGITNSSNSHYQNYDEKPTNDSSLSDFETTPVGGEIKSLTYLEKQKKLYNSEYKYKFRITGEVDLLYSGYYTNGIYEGYKETLDNALKYRIEDGKIYEVKLDEKIEITNLYQGLDEKLFDFKSIFAILNTKTTIIDRSNSSKSYTYENIDGYKYVIYMTETEITKIIINNEHLNYEFTFEY